MTGPQFLALRLPAASDAVTHTFRPFLGTLFGTFHCSATGFAGETRTRRDRSVAIFRDPAVIRATVLLQALSSLTPNFNCATFPRCTVVGNAYANGAFTSFERSAFAAAAP